MKKLRMMFHRHVSYRAKQFGGSLIIEEFYSLNFLEFYSQRRPGYLSIFLVGAFLHSKWPTITLPSFSTDQGPHSELSISI